MRLKPPGRRSFVYTSQSNENPTMTAPSIGTKGRLAFAGLVFGLALAATPPQAFAYGSGASTVQSLYDTLLTTMRNGATLGARGRYGRIQPIVGQVFDVPFMTRLAVGPEWASLSDALRQQVSQAFERYIAAIYAERFNSYSGERFQVTGERPSPGGTIITTLIYKSSGEPVSVNYLMRDNGGVWQIADVYLDGTISELATRRSEFASILRTRGINGLIQVLNVKADTLARAS